MGHEAELSIMRRCWQEYGDLSTTHQVVVRDVPIGGPSPVVIAGPCAVESFEQTLNVARAVRAAGAKLMRGGAFKPRTNPHSFQGLGEEGLEILAEVRRQTGLGIVTEVLDTRLVERVAPSLILFTGENPFDAETYPQIRRAVRELDLPRKRGIAVRLVSCTRQADDLLLATILHHSAAAPFDDCRRTVKGLDQEAKRELLLKAFEHAELYDAALREFEVVSLTFELVVSASCFAQLKRHRMAANAACGKEIAVTVPGVVREGYSVRAVFAVKGNTEFVEMDAISLFGVALGFLDFADHPVVHYYHLLRHPVQIKKHVGVLGLRA